MAESRGVRLPYSVQTVHVLVGLLWLGDEDLMGGGLDLVTGGTRETETETERLIRLGEITPFQPTTAPPTCEVATPPPAIVSDFEKYLLEQGKKTRAKKRSVKKVVGRDGSDGVSDGVSPGVSGERHAKKRVRKSLSGPGPSASASSPRLWPADQPGGERTFEKDCRTGRRRKARSEEEWEEDVRLTDEDGDYLPDEEEIDSEGESL